LFSTFLEFLCCQETDLTPIFGLSLKVELFL
jgi:hypothetical protein